MTAWTTHGGFCENQPLAEPTDILEGLYSAVAQTKPKWWRLLCAWNYIAKARDPGAAVAGKTYNGFTPPATANRDWSTLDRCVNRILSQVRCSILMVIGQSRPGYTSGAAIPTDYAAFCVEVVQRFGPGGNGLTPENIAAGRSVTAVEVWNEENVSFLWDGNVIFGFGRQVNPTEYVSYLKAAYPAVKAATPAVTVVFGGTQHVRRTDKGYWGDGFLTEQEIDFYTRCFAAEPNLGDYVDAFAVHPYTTADAATTGFAPDDSDDAWLQTDLIRALLVSKGCSDVPVWVTEVGWPTNVVTEQQQSDYTQTAFEMWAARPWIETFIIYSAWDRLSSRIEKEKFYGCLHRDFSPKPLYTYLKDQAGTLMVLPTGHVQVVGRGPDVAAQISLPTGHVQTAGKPVIYGAYVLLPTGHVTTTGRVSTVTADNVYTLPKGSVQVTGRASAIKRVYAETFSGTTKPAGVTDGGENDDTFVLSGILREGNVLTGANGAWYSWVVSPNALNTLTAKAQVTVDNLNGVLTNRGAGAALFADVNNGYIATVVGLSGTVGAQIQTVTGTLDSTVRASNASITALASDVVELRASVSTGGVVTVTIFINGVTTGVSFTDTHAVITPPVGGWLWGASFLRRRSGGVDYRSPGITAWAAQDI